MAAGTSPIFIDTVVCTKAAIVPGDTTTKKTLVVAGADGTRVDEVYVTSDDTAAVVLNFYITNGGTDYYIGNETVPIGAGYTTVLRKDCMVLLAPVLGALFLVSGDTLKVAANATITAAKTVTVVAQGGDY
jgi:hypothetical protein